MREPDWRPETTHGGTPMWGILIIANVLCFILQYTVKGFYSNLALYPALLKEGHVYQLLTFQFLHGDLFHIIINCLMIWMMGKPIEEALGKRRLLFLYLLSGVVGGLVQCGLAWSDINPTGGVVGASAGVFGLIASFALLQWNREMTILLMFIIPIRIRAKYLLIALAVIGLLGVLTQRQVIESSAALVAHGAHLGGLLGGVFFILAFVQGGTWAGAEPWWQRISERWNERKVVTIDGGVRAYPRDRSRGKARKVEFVEESIDTILDKISEKGMDSLTDKERAVLDKAAKNSR
ncbi:rhomboid family intramembrane serine protease [Verrucomicrobia bacterium]|nr:rhomboid family intramembrane serine protease [Verrucomicrobiota bacterium]